MLIKNAKIRNFNLTIKINKLCALLSTSSCLQTKSEDEAGINEVNISRKERFSRIANHKLNQLIDERNALKEHLDSVKPAIAAQSDISMGRYPSAEYNRDLFNIRDNYPAFFDNSDEEEDKESKLTKIKRVKDYITSELKANDKQTKDLLEYKNKVLSGESPLPNPRWVNDISDERYTAIAASRGIPVDRSGIETGSSSSRPIVVEESSSRPIIETGSSLSRPIMVEEDSTESSKSKGKRRADQISNNEDSATESSKKSRQSPGDYIDSLPELPYNPLDDWD